MEKTQQWYRALSQVKVLNWFMPRSIATKHCDLVLWTSLRLDKWHQKKTQGKFWPQSDWAQTGAFCKAIYKSPLSRMLTDLFSRTRGKKNTKQSCLISLTATNGNCCAQAKRGWPEIGTWEMRSQMIELWDLLVKWVTESTYLITKTTLITPKVLGCLLGLQIGYNH